MTQIAFHRKLVDRGMTVIGDGNRAYLQDYTKVLKEVSEIAVGETDWRAKLQAY
jgi:hypothetical protein